MREIDEKLCFVLMPFYEPFDTLYREVIKPAVTDTDLYPRRADEIYSVHPFMTDIWGRIWKSRVVVAELTGRNPNVMYELGLCHAIDVPTILIAQTVDDIPSDFRHVRCIIYDRDNLDTLSKALRETLWEVLADEKAGVLLPDVGQRAPSVEERIEGMSDNQQRLYRFIFEKYKSGPVALKAITARLKDPSFGLEGSTLDNEAYYRLMTMVRLELLELLPDRQWRKSRFRIPPQMFKLLKQHSDGWLAE
jgi:hypothetical protein